MDWKGFGGLDGLDGLDGHKNGHNMAIVSFENLEKKHYSEVTSSVVGEYTYTLGSDRAICAGCILRYFHSNIKIIIPDVSGRFRRFNSRNRKRWFNTIPTHTAFFADGCMSHKRGRKERERDGILLDHLRYYLRAIDSAIADL